MEMAADAQESGKWTTFFHFVSLVFFLLFVGLGVGWAVLAGCIHKFATWQPDALHSFAVHEHGRVFYVSRALGRLYASLPLTWISLLVAVSISFGLIIYKSRRSM